MDGVFAYVFLAACVVIGDQVVRAVVRKRDPDSVDTKLQLPGDHEYNSLEDDPHDVGSILQAAEEGDTDAMLTISGYYTMGIGGLQDDAEAFEWCKRAVEAGDPDGLMPLATMLRYGLGTERDDSEALRLYEILAEEGDVAAMIYAAEMHERGLGTARDEATATAWLRKAERIATPRQYTRLGDVYLTGDVKPPDYAKAFDLYMKGTQCEFPALFRSRGNTKSGPDPLALIAVGRMYAQGNAVEQDQSRADDWFVRALDTRSPTAIALLAEMFRTGDCVPRDEKRAAELSEMAVMLGFVSFEDDSRPDIATKPD